MSDSEPGEGFLRRWSRVKSEVREAAPAPGVPAAPTAPEPPQTRAASADGEAPQLPPVENLTLESDFSGFFHPKVDEDLRRSALRKLFSDPHFNVMDGLDVYIDDYSKSEPIPAAMLASLKQAQRILDWAANKTDAPEAPGRAPESVELQSADGAIADAQGVAPESIEAEPSAASPLRAHSTPDGKS